MRWAAGGEGLGFLVDTNFMIDLLRDRAPATQKTRALQDSGEVGYLPTPVVYEIQLGFLLARSRSEAATFRALAGEFARLPFDEPAAVRAAEVQAEMNRAGRPLSDMDVMIAGIALDTGNRLVTRDKGLRAAGDVLGFAVEAY